MDILHFELVDLGPGAEGYFDEWGASYRGFNSSVIGAGKNAKEAFDDALNQLAFDGFGTKLLHEAGIEDGYLSEAARIPAEDIEPHAADEDGEDEIPEEPVVYHVGIRFQNEETEQAQNA